MLLAVDIGNTTTVVGFYNGPKLEYRYSIRSDYGHSLEEISSSFSLFLKDKGIERKTFEGAIISCVVPSLETWWKALLKDEYGLRPYVVGPKLKTGLVIKTDNPKEVGSDLIADAVAAKSLYGENVLIADLGTANKVILIGKDGAFEGCTIALGIGLSARALSLDAALLPSVSMEIPNRVLGKNTPDSMNSALTYGVSYEIRGLCDAIEKEAGVPCKRIMTGGYARFLKDLLNDFEYVDELTLLGLRLIYERNKK